MVNIRDRLRVEHSPGTRALIFEILDSDFFFTNPGFFQVFYSKSLADFVQKKVDILEKINLNAVDSPGTVVVMPPLTRLEYQPPEQPVCGATLLFNSSNTFSVVISSTGAGRQSKISSISFSSSCPPAFCLLVLLSLASSLEKAWAKRREREEQADVSKVETGKRGGMTAFS